MRLINHYVPPPRFLGICSCCLSLLLTLSCYCRAQQALDSIAASYSQANYQDGSKFLKAGEYARTLFFNNRQQEAMELLAENSTIAKKNKDGKYAAYLYGIQALNARILDDSIQARHFIDSAKTFAAMTADREIRGYVQYCDGWLHVRDNREVEAVRAFTEALQTLETVNSFKYKSAIYKELYAIYTNWSAFELQKKYATLNLGLAKKNGAIAALFDAYMLMGGMYEYGFRKDQRAAAIRDSAQYYYQAAVNTYQNNKEKMVIPSDLAHATNNLANLYLEFYPESYRDDVEKYAELTIEISTQTEQHSFLASAYGILSDLSRKDGDLERAKSYLLAALASIMNEALPSKEIVSRIFFSLSEVFEQEGDYTEALHYYKQYVSLFGEIYDAEKMELAQRLEAQYEKEKQQQQLTQLRLESEQKEQRIELMNALSEKQHNELEVMKLTAKNNQQELAFAKLQNLQKQQQLESAQREVELKSRINRFYIVFIAAALFLTMLLLYAYRQRSRTLRQQRHLHRLEMDHVTQQSAISNLTAMLDGQEQERTRLARDLHDGLGGILSGTKIELSAVPPRLEDPVVKQQVSKSLVQLDTAVNELRRIAHNLMPELLIKYGLAEAIREYGNRMSSGGLEVDTQIINYANGLDTNRQVMAYRIIQELVNNAVKHAAATHILVQLAQRDDTIFLTVEDDGKGFDVSSLNGQKSAGIHTIQSRLDFLKGHIHIDSQQGMGTTAEIEFPVTHND